MADWKQITARIRRARTGKDPVGQLSNLFEKTHDAMVAFELARYFETAGQNPEAAKWYLAAANRFRRADWKTKAQEAAVRLGAEIPPADASPASGDFQLTSPPAASPAPSLFDADNVSAPDSAISAPAAEAIEAPASQALVAADSPDKKKRRRGRRGGRNRRKGPLPKVSAHPSTAATSEPEPLAKGLPPRVCDDSEQPKPPRVTDSR
ncbi:MAG: hypothetical protein ACRD36_04920, partial [Candidatus Acidiferrum sp.]